MLKNKICLYECSMVIQPFVFIYYKFNKCITTLRNINWKDIDQMGDQNWLLRPAPEAGISTHPQPLIHFQME